MKNLYWLILLIGVVLIVVHGFFSYSFLVDWITITIYFIICIPIFAPYLKKAKLPGGLEFEYKDDIQKTKKLVDLSIEKTEKAVKAGTARILSFETFKLKSIKDLFESDHVLALAALRIEIEKKLRLFAKMLNVTRNDKLPLIKIIQILAEKEILNIEQINALREIINMCNKAIHGISISEKAAGEIIHLTEQLNKSFAIGYSIDFYPNKDYDKHNLICEWEHCIELMPVSDNKEKSCCRIFSHKCPGGAKKVGQCDKRI